MNKTVNISTEDKERIKYIFKIVLEYINTVGPRDLRDHKDELIELINKLSK